MKLILTSILNRNITQIIYILLLLFYFKGTNAQDLSLKITSENKNELSILSDIEFSKKHKDSISLKLEVNKISDYLKNLGYFINTVSRIEKTAKSYTVFYSLNNKIEKAHIKVSSKLKIYFEKLEVKNGVYTIPISKLKSTLINISKKLDKEGKSFSKVQLKDVLIENKNLFADLEIYQSKKRIINKVILKGYEGFPKTYLKNYFNIKPTTIFNQQKIEEISTNSKNLQFISEIKPPEILFTKDSTFLYMYLKKKQNNSFDGIVNFSSKENGGFLLNGNINLKLNNILNTGEKFELFWNSIGDERQELKLSTENPYIFNSKFSSEISFSIYKQDSTFLNTKFDSKVYYTINSKTKLAITYNSESSENLKKDIANNNETFNNSFYGFQFQYNIPKNDFFFNNKFSIEINPSFGQRTTNTTNSNQFKIIAETSYIWDISLRSSIFLQNKTGYLNSNKLLNNELFRIGGTNSIRGFNEQSIFTNNFSFFNIEYRFLTSKKSYLYTITDIAKTKSYSKNENFIGIGLGYLFSTKKSQINIRTAFGKNTLQKFNFNNSKLIISWKNYF